MFVLVRHTKESAYLNSFINPDNGLGLSFHINNGWSIYRMEAGQEVRCIDRMSVLDIITAGGTSTPDYCFTLTPELLELIEEEEKVHQGGVGREG